MKEQFKAWLSDNGKAGSATVFSISLEAVSAPIAASNTSRWPGIFEYLIGSKPEKAVFEVSGAAEFNRIYGRFLLLIDADEKEYWSFDREKYDKCFWYTHSMDSGTDHRRLVNAFKYFRQFLVWKELREHGIDIEIGSLMANSNDSLGDMVFQRITYGAPGTGKSFSTDQETKGKATFRTTFHPDTDYSNFVGSYKPTKAVDPYETVVKVGTQNGGNIIQQDRLVRKSEISYDFVPQAFIRAYVAAWKKYAARVAAGGPLTDDDQVYLVIEEINRGHCAQIFGDLFQLLDRNEEGFSDYPIDADVDLAKWLHVQFAADDFGDELKAMKGYEEDGKLVLKLCLPPNLYIRATMNTSDQSLFPMDSAFKRRWDWRYVPISEPDEEDEPGFNKRKVLCKIGGENSLERWFDWWEFLKVINTAILNATKSEDKQLGYFFVKVPNDPGEISAEKFAGKVLFYLYNDVFKDYNYPDAVFAKKNQPAGSPKVKYAFKDFFDAKGRAKDAMVAEFLENLGIPFEDKQLPA